jgi:hypothetical protein
MIKHSSFATGRAQSGWAQWHTRQTKVWIMSGSNFWCLTKERFLMKIQRDSSPGGFGFFIWTTILSSFFSLGLYILIEDFSYIVETRLLR